MQFIVEYRRVPHQPMDEAALKGHLGYLRDLAQRGIVLMAGPYTEAEGGLVLLEAPDLAVAQALTLADPLVASGVDEVAIKAFRATTGALLQRRASTLTTAMTEMLGIEVPLMQGGIHWLARAEMAAAVSNAGGLGTISALSLGGKAELLQEIDRARSLTDKPFGINISMLPEMAASDEMYIPLFQACADAQVTVVETSGRNPAPFLPILAAKGVKVIHKVPAVRFAQKAQSIGVDAVAVVGYECGGHPGMDNVGTMALIPRVVDSVTIPVIAGGGMADGRGIAAALALGASGVIMGTRFLATKECPLHPTLKEWLLQADERSTVLILGSIRNAMRVLRNPASDRVAQLETCNPSLDEVVAAASSAFTREAYTDGDKDNALMACGQGVGLIRDLPTTAELMERLVKEALAAR